MFCKFRAQADYSVEDDMAANGSVTSSPALGRRADGGCVVLSKLFIIENEIVY